MLDKKLMEILACPVCKLGYPIRDDVPVMLIDEARSLSGN